MTKIEAYSKIIKVINSTIKDIRDSPKLNNIRHELEELILVEELTEAFGIEIKYMSGSNYVKLGSVAVISLMGEKYGRTIPWSDDGKQPTNEWLLKISFPEGAYVFGDDYQTETMGKFFNELKSFEPKYVDTVNNSLYFSSDKAKVVYEAYEGIYKKYCQIAVDNRKDSRIAKLKKQLEDLEK